MTNPNFNIDGFSLETPDQAELRVKGPPNAPKVSKNPEAENEKYIIRPIKSAPASEERRTAILEQIGPGTKKPEVQPNIVEPPREEPTTYDDRKLCQIAEGLGYDRARIVRLTPSEIRYRFDTLYQHNRKEWSGATALGTFTVAATGGILAIGSSVPGSAFAVSSLLAAPLAMPTFLVGSALLLGGGMALGAGYQIFKSWKNRRKADKALQEGGY